MKSTAKFKILLVLNWQLLNKVYITAQLDFKKRRSFFYFIRFFSTLVLIDGTEDEGAAAQQYLESKPPR